MSGLSFPVCTFSRVFDTVPAQQVVTLEALMRTLRRFEVKEKLHKNLERQVEWLHIALHRWLGGSREPDRTMTPLLQAAAQARAAGEDEERVVRERVEAMALDIRRTAKQDLRLWSPTLYLPGAVKRGSEHVSHLSCLVLDVDDGMPIGLFTERWTSYFHIVHTTWSHTPERPKYRVVFPLSSPVDAAQWPRVWAWAEQRCERSIDAALKSPASTYALPVLPHRAWPREAFCHPGALLDPVAEGLVETPPPMPEVAVSIDPEASFVDGKVDALYIEHEGLDPNAAPTDVIYGDDDLSQADLWSGGAVAPRVTRLEPPSVAEANAVGSPVPSRATSGLEVAAELEAIREVVRGLAARVTQLEARELDRDSLLDALERLAALHERGALSDEELDQAKQRILASGAKPSA